MIASELSNYSSHRLELQDIQALAALQGVFTGFRNGIQDITSAGRTEIQQALDWIQQNE